MKGKGHSFILIGLILLLVLPLTGCLPALTFLGFRVQERTIDSYANEIAPILEEWEIVVDDWENKANDPERTLYRDLDAEDCQERMQVIISAWDIISPPNETMEYHSWMRLAMDYEREAFGVMKEYCQLALTFGSNEDELRHLHNLAIELWILKDKALYQAIEVYPSE